MEIQKEAGKPATAVFNHQLEVMIDNMWIQGEKESNQQWQIVLADGPRLCHEEMPWESSVTAVDQYNKMFIDRMQKLAPRIGISNYNSLEQIESNSGVIHIVGMVKRVEFKRVRAFEKNYQHYYETAQTIYDPRDTLELEDPTGKVIFKLGKNLTCNGKPLRPIDLPYGVVVGLKGKFNDYQHHFEATQIHFPELPPQRPFKPSTQVFKSKLILICEPTYRELEELLEEVTQRSLLPEIQGVIIAGYHLRFSTEDTKKADQLYLKHSEYLDIYIMPGQNSKFLLPQKPYHCILYPKSRHSVFLCNNPQVFSNQKSLEMLVLDSRTLKDLIKNCAMFSSEVEALLGLLSFSHLAPTAPFSLKCSIMPKDNLIMNSSPHLMIATSCDTSSIKDFEKDGRKVKLITTPKGKSVLLDQNTLQVTPFTFKSIADHNTMQY